LLSQRINRTKSHGYIRATSGLSSTKNLGKSEEIMIRKFIKDEQGQDIVEYSLLLVLIGATALFVLTAMGKNIGEIFAKINNRLATANTTLGS